MCRSFQERLKVSVLFIAVVKLCLSTDPKFVTPHLTIPWFLSDQAQCMKLFVMLCIHQPVIEHNTA